ncbi:MAG: Inner rane component of cytoplasmic domain [Myxococcales bacterium]|nr:Inner rane component of cytoplasmic domain [Myxococcales bacterium]
MFDKLKGLFGGGEAPPADAIPSARRAAVPRRPAKPRAARASLAGKSSGALTPPPEMSNEVACPNCGEPMLAGWGTTCGKCRPTMVAPKTMFGGESAAVKAGAPGLVLGWLVVLRSIDKTCAGRLHELEADVVVLSRTAAFDAVGVALVEISDEYMSGGHSVLRRPRTRAKTDAFTLRDRWDPGPSANGTFVNSRKLAPNEEMRLADGDIIKVGATEMLFKSLWLPPAGARAP